jgi:hypothetical protein
MKTTGEKKTIRVLVSTNSGNLATLADQLRDRGMRVDSVLDALGIVTGEVDAERLGDLMAIQGVTVEPEGSVSALQQEPPSE